MIRITSIHLAGGEDHQHIQSVTWVNPATNERGGSNLQTMIAWLREGGEATVTVGAQQENVQVVEGGAPFIQAYENGSPTDSLLALPRY